MVPTVSFVSHWQSHPSHIFPQEEGAMSPHASQVILRSCFLPPVYLSLLPSFQEYGSIFRSLSQPRPGTSKSPVFEISWLQNSKFSTSHFPSQYIWGKIISLCNTLCAPISLSPSFVTLAALIPFSPKPLLLTSYLLQTGLFSPSSCAVCSTSHEFDFLSIQNNLLVIQLCSRQEASLGSSYYTTILAPR